MAKYGPKASEKVEKTMHEFKRGELKSGSGEKVKSRKQAIAIGLSEAREAGGKVPSRRSSSGKRSTTSSRGASTRKRATRRTTSRKRTSGRTKKS